MTPRPAIRSLGAADLVVLEGEVDIAGVPAIEGEVLRRTRRSPAVILDLSRVEYLDSAGVRLVDHLVGECARRGVPIRVVAPPSNPALRTLGICEFPSELVDGSLADALSAVEADGA